jgi:UDP-N-acetylmuramate dehydrogenase
MIENNISLKKANTFGLDAVAPQLVDVKSEEDLNILRTTPPYSNTEWLILGGGSNILFTKSPSVPVVRIAIPGIEFQKSSGNTVLVKVGAGVVWHDLVTITLNNGVFGLENLSLIPGRTGASPIQNIGAYGVELNDVFESLQAWNIKTGKSQTMYRDDCRFGYRNSIFKEELKGDVVITSVTLRLSDTPNLRLDYGDIRKYLSDAGLTNPTPLDVSNAVISIRQSKLPDPNVIGNAGSFFKNPEIDSVFYDALKTKFADMPGYVLADGRVKIPAGWLIDRLGWKGYRDGDAGVHDKQALVLVNHGSATGGQIAALSRKILASVQESYGIRLETEVNIL